MRQFGGVAGAGSLDRMSSSFDTSETHPLSGALAGDDDQQLYVEDAFEEYLYKFEDLAKSLHRCLDAVETVTPAERDATMDRAVSRMSEIETVVESMRNDLRSLPFRNSSSMSRSLINSKLKECSRDSKQLKQEMNVVIYRYRFSRMTVHEREERNRLLYHDNIHGDINKTARESQTLIADIESVASRTSSTLHTQGLQLDDIKSDLVEANTAHERAARLLRNLRRRMYTDRALQTIIVILEIIIIGIVIYIRFIQK